MSMERALFEKLKAIVGNPDIFALRAPDNALGPFIIYQRRDSDRWRTVEGPNGILTATMQIDFYAPSYHAVRKTAVQVELAFDGFRGVVAYPASGGDAAGSVDFKSVSVETDLDLADQTDEPFLYRVSADYLITYAQS